MPSTLTVTRYFDGFVRSQVEHLAAVLGPFTLGACSRRRWAQCSTWTRPSSSVTARKKAASRSSREDFGADGFCLQSFDGTEAAFRLICFLYNLVADFKRHALQDETLQLSTVRTQLLGRGAILGADGHRRVLRLGLRGRWRDHFAALLARSPRITASTVAQLANASTDRADLPRHPWPPRRPDRLSPLASAFGSLIN